LASSDFNLGFVSTAAWMIRIGICAIHRCTRQAAQAKSFLGGHAVTRKEPTVFFREKNIEPKQLLKRKK
jgi:hypothetical protein